MFSVFGHMDATTSVRHTGLMNFNECLNERGLDLSAPGTESLILIISAIKRLQIYSFCAHGTV